MIDQFATVLPIAEVASVDDPAELAYAACYFDGEGCITVPNKGQLRVVIQTYDYSALKYFAELFGGRFSETTRHYRNSQVRKQHRIFRRAANNNDALLFLRKVRPYLKAKGAQADIAISLWPPITASRLTKGELETVKHSRAKAQLELHALKKSRRQDDIPSSSKHLTSM